MSSSKKRHLEKIKDNKLALIDFFKDIEDPRKEKNRKYPLEDIFIILIYGLLHGRTSVAGICRYCSTSCISRKLRKQFGVNAIPSHDTISRTLRMLRPQHLRFALSSWSEMLVGGSGGHIILDGKSVNAAGGNIGRKGEYSYYNMGAMHRPSGIVLTQTRVGEKTNEMTTLPKILSLIDLEGSMVTTDAIGFLQPVIELIIRSGGDFMLPIKNNHKSLLADLRFTLNSAVKEKKATSYDSGYATKHGRRERRIVCGCIIPEEEAEASLGPEGRHVRSIFRVERHRKEKKASEESIQIVYYASSQAMDAEEAAEIIRGHWDIENRLHYILDNTFREDRCNTHYWDATENLSCMRKFAFNIMVLSEIKTGRKIEDMSFFLDQPKLIRQLLFNPVMRVVA